MPITKIEFRNDPDERNPTAFVRGCDVVHDAPRIALDLCLTDPFGSRYTFLRQRFIDFRQLRRPWLRTVPIVAGKNNRNIWLELERVDRELPNLVAEVDPRKINDLDAIVAKVWFQ